MANDFYTASGTPSTGSPGSSAPVRSEFVLIQAGFNKLAPLTASTIVAVNAGGTAQTNLTTTGTGDVVLATSPTLITPNLGTPTSGVLTNCIGLPNAGLSNSSITIGSTAVSLGATATTIAGLTLTSPVLGAATATSINKMAITAPATSSTLAVADGKTFTASKTLTLTGTDGTTMTFPSTSATLARTDAANTFTGHQTIEGVTSAGATGTGNMVFSDSPIFATAATLGTGGTGGASLYAVINGGNGAGANFGVSLRANGSGTTSAYYYDVNSGTARISAGTLDPAISISANSGALAFKGYGAGTLTTDASGNVTASSDGSLKDILGAYVRSTDDVAKIDTCQWRWNEVSKMDGSTIQSSYTAQAVQVGVPEAISVGPDGKLTVFDGAIIAALINSVKDLNARLKALGG